MLCRAGQLPLALWLKQCQGVLRECTHGFLPQAQQIHQVFARCPVRAGFHFETAQDAGAQFRVAVLFEPLHRVLESRREETSQVPEIQSNAIEMHEEILRSLEMRDPERSRVAMDNHMTQTLRDLQHYVLGAP